MMFGVQAGQHGRVRRQGLAGRDRARGERVAALDRQPAQRRRVERRDGVGAQAVN